MISFLLMVGCTAGQEWEAWQPTDPALTWDEVPEPTLEAAGLEGPAGLALWLDEIVVAEEDGGRVRAIESGEVWVDDLSGPTWLEATDWGLVIADGAAGDLWLLESSGDLHLLSSGHAELTRLSVDGSELWWLDSAQGELWSLELPEGDARLAGEGLQTPVGLSVVDGRPWVVEQDTESLLVLDLETAEWTTLAELEDPPYDLATDGERAFITTRSTRWPYGGFILSVTDLDVEEISYSPPEPERIELDESHVYWSSKQSITRVSRQGGTYELVAGVTAVEDFILVDDGIIWTDGQAGEVRSW